MILKDDSRSSFWSARKLAIVLSVMLLLSFLFFFYKNNKALSHLPKGGIRCDAENVQGDHYQCGAYVFTNGQTQSSDFAFSGSYSCHLPAADKPQYGFGYKIENPQGGIRYKATVWRLKNAPKGNSFLVAAAPDGDFYWSEKLAFRQKGNWEQLELTFAIPFKKNFDYVQVYVYSDGGGSVYFDDLAIVVIDTLETRTAHFRLDTIQLRISEKAMRHLEAKRLSAFQKGILETEEDDWVKGKILSKDGKHKKVKLRLKGDWLNHLEDDKWSFRIHLSGGEAWNRLRRFSLHTPAARGFLHEWLLHRFFERENLLTTRYNFVLLELNKKNLGVYAIEEHFDKVLVESRQRREGVIVKFSESGFWASMHRQLQYTGRVDHQLLQNEKQMQTASVLPFGEKATFSSPLLAEQFERAQNLLQQFQLGHLSVAEVFDVDRMARYFAICDVMGATHGIAWHNQRFYYNPLSGKLEPIGYDGFEGQELKHQITGRGAMKPHPVFEETFHHRLFLDSAFVARYVSHLYRYSSEEYVQDFLTEQYEPLRLREKLLQTEFPDYHFDIAAWKNDIRSIHLQVLPLPGISLKAYTEGKQSGTKQVQVANIHSLPIEILGYGADEEVLLRRFAKTLLLEGYYPRAMYEAAQAGSKTTGLPDGITRSDMQRFYDLQIPLRFHSLAVPEQSKYLFFRPLGLDTLMYSRISPWSSPYKSWGGEALLEPSKIASCGMYELKDSVLYFRKGKHILQSPLVVPAGYRLSMGSGCEIDLRQGAFIWTASPVCMQGRAEEPVRIHTSDGSGRGFHVMEAEGESHLDYVVFDGLNTLSEKERRLTGAVTFYASDVRVSHSVFRESRCEDALNLIRCDFEMSDCKVLQTFGDGVDTDFCKGSIKRTHFADTGNDGLDVSGSVILIKDCFFESNGDKAISIGEASDVSILWAHIKTAPIAVAVKDLSVLLVSDIRLEDCRQGFVAYQKKPEYGSGSIVVENYEAENVKRLYQVDEGGRVEFRDSE